MPVSINAPVGDKRINSLVFEDYTDEELEIPAAATALNNIKSQSSLSTLFQNVKAFGKGCLLNSQLVKNTSTNNSNLPLAASVGYSLNQNKVANSNVLTLEEIAAASNLSGKVASASAVNTLNYNNPYRSHNIPRLVPKDITSYYTDGTLWKRLAGTDGYSLHEDIFVGDYFKMSRPISAYERTGNYQRTGSQYVTIAGISSLKGNGDNISMMYEHLVMVPGQGFGGDQHFGRSRMNSSNTTSGGYVGSEMYTTTIGAVTSSGSTSSTASINQQLYAEFGSHLQTTRELLSKSVNSSGYNRFGTNGGCSNGWDWYSCQAVLMSEIEVYGSVVWSSSGYDTGTANTRLPLFAYNTSALNNRSAWYWLKDVASASGFCDSYGIGSADYLNASRGDGFVRPRFVIA